MPWQREHALWKLAVYMSVVDSRRPRELDQGIVVERIGFIVVCGEGDDAFGVYFFVWEMVFIERSQVCGGDLVVAKVVQDGDKLFVAFTVYLVEFDMYI